MTYSITQPRPALALRGMLQHGLRALIVAIMPLTPLSAAMAATPVWQTLPVELPLPPLKEGRVQHNGSSLWP